MYILHYPRDKASENLRKLEYEGSVETKIVGLRASGIRHTTSQRDGPKGFVQERKGGNTMKGTASKNAQDILRGYVESIKDKKDTTALVTTYCYDNFAQGVRAVMPDVDEETIDQMYAASGFETGKYRGSISQSWYEDTATLKKVALIIDSVLANVQDGMPLSLTDLMAASDIKACDKSWDYCDKRFSAHESRTDSKRAIDALVYGDRFSRTAVKTCGRVHIYLYTPIV